LLKKRFAPGEDEAIAVVTRDERRDLSGGEFDDLPCFGKLDAILMLPRSFLPVPSVRSIAPVAMEVAKGESQKDGGGSE
jgi:hypothetical protein